MHNINTNNDLIDFLQIIINESKNNIVGFYDMKKLNKTFKLRNVKLNQLIELNNEYYIIQILDILNNKGIHKRLN